MEIRSFIVEFAELGSDALKYSSFLKYSQTASRKPPVAVSTEGESVSKG